MPVLIGSNRLVLSLDLRMKTRNANKTKEINSKRGMSLIDFFMMAVLRIKKGVKQTENLNPKKVRHLKIK